MLNKMDISKFRLDVFGEIVGVGGGLAALQLLWAIKGSFSFQFPTPSHQHVQTYNRY